MVTPPGGPESLELTPLAKHELLLVQGAIRANHFGDFVYGNVCEFLWLQLMKATAINSSLADHGSGIDLVQFLPDRSGQIRVLTQRFVQRRLWVEHEVNVCRNCARMIQDKSEWPTAFSI